MQKESKRIVLAVSGGIDSMVLLDIFAKGGEVDVLDESRKMGKRINVFGEKDNVVVVHFNHGVRESADKDEEFVKERAFQYGFCVECGRANLGARISEERAREERYRFLFEVAEKVGGEIYTAHHMDDLIESVAINILRGTGWRGLAVMNRRRIVRPFLEWGVDKKWIYKYASKNGVLWRADSTNCEGKYLRNRIREAIWKRSLLDKNVIYDVAMRQREITNEIQGIFDKGIAEGEKMSMMRREWLFGMDEKVAYEWLRWWGKKHRVSFSPADLEKLLMAIRTYKAGKKVNLSKNVMVKIWEKYFYIEQ